MGQTLVPDEQLGGLSKEQWDLMDWDTTPQDLRDPEESTLAQYCASHGFSVQTAMKWRKLDNYRLRRRQLSIEKGETDHKIAEVLDSLYSKAHKGDVPAAKEFLRHYSGDEKAKPDDQGDRAPEVKLEDEPKSIEEMTLEELEAWRAKL